MFTFTVPQHIVKMCNDAIDTGEVVLASRGVADGDKKDQKCGYIGELAINEVLFGITAKVENTGFDGGWDLEYGRPNGPQFKIDIKTKNINKPYVLPRYEHNILKYQKDYPVDGYIFARLHLDTMLLFVCTICRKKDFFSCARFDKKNARKDRDDGSHFNSRDDMYSVFYEQMQDVTCELNMKKWILQWEWKS